MRTNFDDVKCGTDEHFPSRDECSSNEDASSDDSVKDIYVEVAATTNAKDEGHVCAAGEFCGMKAIPLDGLHSCVNCSKLMHGALCGTLRAERGDPCKVTV